MTRFAIPSVPVPNSQLGAPLLSIPSAPMNGLAVAGDSLARGLNDLAKAQSHIKSAHETRLFTEQQTAGMTIVETGFDVASKASPEQAETTFQTHIAEFTESIRAIKSPNLRKALELDFQRRADLMLVQVRRNALDREVAAIGAALLNQDRQLNADVSTGRKRFDVAITEFQSALDMHQPSIGPVHALKFEEEFAERLVKTEFSRRAQYDLDGAENFISNNPIAVRLISADERQQRKQEIVNLRNNRAVEGILQTKTTAAETFDEMFADGALPDKERLEERLRLFAEDMTGLSHDIKNKPPTTVKSNMVELLQPQIEAAVAMGAMKRFELLVSVVPKTDEGNALVAKAGAIMVNARDERSRHLYGRYVTRSEDAAKSQDLGTLRLMLDELNGDALISEPDRETARLHIQSEIDQLNRDLGGITRLADAINMGRDLTGQPIGETVIDGYLKRAINAGGNLVDHSFAVFKTTGRVPDRFVDELWQASLPENIATPQGLQNAMTMLQPFFDENVDVARSTATAAGTEGANLAYLALATTDQLDRQSTKYADIVNTLSAATAQDGYRKAVTQLKQVSSLQQYQSLRLAMGSLLSISPKLRSDFNQQFILNYIRDFNRAGTTNAQIDRQIAERAATTAAQEMGNHFVSIRVPGRIDGESVAVPAKLGIGTQNRPYAPGKDAFERAITLFANRESEMPDNAVVSPERFVTINDKAYIPAIGIDDQGAPEIKRVLEWDMDDRTHRYIDASWPEFAQVASMYTNQLEPRDADPDGALKYLPDYGEIGVLDTGHALGRDFSRDFINAAEREWVKTYGTLPDPGDPLYEDQVLALMRSTLAKSRRQGWSQWNSTGNVKDDGATNTNTTR